MAVGTTAATVPHLQSSICHLRRDAVAAWFAGSATFNSPHRGVPSRSFALFAVNPDSSVFVYLVFFVVWNSGSFRALRAFRGSASGVRPPNPGRLGEPSLPSIDGRRDDGRYRAASRRPPISDLRSAISAATQVAAWSRYARNGGPDRDQTDDLVVANDALYQLSYRPMKGRAGFGQSARASKHQFSPK